MGHDFGQVRGSGLKLVGLFLMLVLTACGSTGDTGATGPQGPTGPGGPPGNSGGTATALTITINDVTIGEPSKVDFTVTDQNGNGYPGVPASTLEVMIAQLQPGTNGNADAWQSYINVTAKPNGLGTGTQPATQATTDSGGKLDDHGDGTYTYTFGTDLMKVTSPVKVAYNAALVHRVAIDIRSSTLPSANNGIYTWLPSTGKTSGFTADDIADTASCNSCHDHLAVHGGPRQDVRECVLCHNPGSTDPSSGNTLDFAVMIHKIHDGANLPSVIGGTDYIIWGYMNSKNDFSTVKFPQNIENCTKCHAPSDTNAPDSGDYSSVPTMQACGACHDNIDFSQGVAGGHPGGVVTDNSQCTVCHAANRVADSPANSHIVATEVAAQQFQYNILSVTNTAPTQQPIIKFSITNPQNHNTPYNLTGPQFTAGGGVSRVNIDIAWSTTDYENDGSNSYPGQPISFNALTATANGDGTYSITSPTAIPSTAMGSGAVAIEGHPATDTTTPGTYNVEVPVTGAVKYFAITDAAPVSRRSDVALASCQNCHGQNDGLSLHGSNRTDNLELCEMCHNPDATDLSVRPADPDATANGVNTAAVDGLEQRQIDFKYMIHAIHSAGFRDNTSPNNYLVYAHGNNPTDFSDVLYPGTLADCGQCHTSTGYTLPLPSGVLGTTVNTNATVQTANPNGTQIFYGTVSDVPAYLRITPTTAACSACHNDTLSVAHMTQNGGSLSITQALIDNGSTVETCALCHGPGAVEDVAKVHAVSSGGGG